MNQFVDELKTKSKPILESLKRELASVRASRPSALLVENIKVNYYNQIVPMKQVGTIGVQPPRDIVIQVWDKSAVTAVAKAIEASGLNLSASTEGNVIRIHLPELSEERREELARHVKKITEEHKIQIRHVRDEVMKRVQTAFDAGEINEDAKFKSKEEVQKEVENVNKEIETSLESKIKEIKE